MKSLLTYATGAILMSLVMTGPTDRHGDAGNESDKTHNATRLEVGNITELARWAFGDNKTSNCSDPRIPYTNASFDGTHLDLAGTPKTLTFIVIMCVLGGTTSTMTIIGNAAIITAVIIEPSLRHTTNYILFSLALSDLWVGLVSIPLFTHYVINGYWGLGRFVCNLWLTLDWPVCAASQYSVFLITSNRYLAATAPIWYRNWRTDRKVQIAILFAWAVPFCLFPPLILQYKPEGYVVPPSSHCDVPFRSDPWVSLVVNLLYFWLFTILMCYFYWKIYSVAYNLDGRLAKTYRRYTQTFSTKSFSSKSFSTKSSAAPNVNNSWHCDDVRGGDSRFMHSRADTATEGTASKRSIRRDFNSQNRMHSCQCASRNTNTFFTALSHGGNSLEKGVCPVEESTDNSKFTHEVLAVCGLGKLALTNNLPNAAGSSFETTYRSAATISSRLSHPLHYLYETDCAYRDSLELCRHPITTCQCHHLDQFFPTDTPHAMVRERCVDTNTGEDNHSSNVTSEHQSTDCILNKSIDTAYPSIATTSNDSNNNRNISKDGNSNQHGATSTSGSAQTSSVHFKKPAAAAEINDNSTVSSAKPRSRRRERKTLKTISVVLGAYLICWSPFHLFTSLPAFCGYNCVHPYLYQISYWMCYLNSSINPLLYAYTNEKFRTVLTRGRKRVLGETSTTVW